VLDGLHCKAATLRGHVTVGTLADYVEQRVHAWVKRNREPDATRGIQVAIDRGANDMALGDCHRPPTPVNVATNGEVLTVIGDDGWTLWEKTVQGRSTPAELVDLDGDEVAELVVGDELGKLHVFNARGDTVWPADTNVPNNYPHCRTGRMRVDRLRIDHLFSRKRNRQILTVSQMADGCSRLTAYDHDGTPLWGYWHPGRILDVAKQRPPARHPRQDRPRRYLSGLRRQDPGVEERAVRIVRGKVGLRFMVNG
jgi:hypothetical protein